MDTTVPPAAGVMPLTMTLSGTGWLITTLVKVCESAGVMVPDSVRTKFGPVAVSPSGVLTV
ncbi:hypothetical protein D3C77_573530 [compost metagenome]